MADEGPGLPDDLGRGARIARVRLGAAERLLLFRERLGTSILGILVLGKCRAGN